MLLAARNPRRPGCQPAGAAGRAARPAPGRAARPAPGRAARPAPGRAARPAPGRAARPAPGPAASPAARSPGRPAHRARARWRGLVRHPVQRPALAASRGRPGAPGWFRRPRRRYVPRPRRGHVPRPRCAPRPRLSHVRRPGPRRGPDGRPRGGAAVRHPDQPAQRVRPGQRADERRQHVHRRSVRPGQRASQADNSEDGQAGVTIAEPPHRGHAEARGQYREHDQHADDQRLLVVRAERGDGEVLDRGRSIVDGQAADRRHRRALGPAYPSDKLGHPEGDPGGEQTGPHTAARPGRVLRSFHRSYS